VTNLQQAERRISLVELVERKSYFRGRNTKIYRQMSSSMLSNGVVSCLGLVWEGGPVVLTNVMSQDVNRLVIGGLFVSFFQMHKSQAPQC
jgi:hypothetical protein